MQNLSVGKKLITGFGIVLALLVLSAAVSLYSIGSIGGQIDLYVDYTVPNAEYVRSMQVNMQNILHSLMEAITAESPQETQAALDLAADSGKIVAAGLDDYRNNQRNSDRDADLEALGSVITAAAAKRGEINRLVQDGSDQSLSQAMTLYRNDYKPKIDQAMEFLLGFSATANDRAGQQKSEAASSQSGAWIALIVCAAVSVLLTVLIVGAIRKSIMTPVDEIVGAYREIAKGNLDTPITYRSGDELGQMADLIRDTNRLQATILGDVIEKFSRIADGDLRIRVEHEYPGDFAALKEAILNTAASINHTMHTIDTAAAQVSTGASQVAGGAQALAAGSAEQAASVEELSASAAKIAEQAAENASNVQTANQYVGQAGAGVQAGNEHMDQLIRAMEDIGATSNEIANITRVIEDIAFQTNILALNAAIEAARAGSAGKGFAVVADEVRSLAAKSGEAAKQTSELIRNSVSTVSKGVQISAQTAQILKEVGTHAEKVTESFAKIEEASAEQAGAIEQIKLGLTQVSSVVQTNAATAEENSATSEEMSAQAATLREEVGKFQLDGRRDGSGLSAVAPAGSYSGPAPAREPALSAAGKY